MGVVWGALFIWGGAGRSSCSDSGAGLRGCEGLSHEGVSGRAILGRRSSQCKGPEAGLGLAFTAHSKEASVAQAE